MERKERLNFCRVCKERRMDIKQGIVCGLTGMHADFEGTCSSYSVEPELIRRWEADERNSSMTVKMAGTGKRIVNYLLDRVFVFVFGFVFGLFSGIALLIVAPETIRFFDEEYILLHWLISFAEMIAYYVIFEASTGRTPAKYITGTRVVTAGGEKPRFGTIIIRSLCRFIPLEPLSFLISGSRGLHDRLSKTYVVEV